VAFYMGPLVVGADYNRLLYREGAGIFPAPLKVPYFPDPNSKDLEPKTDDTFQLIIRDEKFSSKPGGTPIFGSIIEEPKHREPLRNLPIRRYWQVARSQWKPEAGKVEELATLPNDALATNFQGQVAEITQGPAMTQIFKDFPKYEVALRRHISRIEPLARAGSEAKAYQLAGQIERILNDQGFEKQKDDFPNLKEFWTKGDPNIDTIRRQLESLRETVHYGDPFIITQNFGKGKVVAIMSTAGKDWNDWAGGSLASLLYAPFIWEMQNYLSSQGGEANLTTGTPVSLTVDGSQFKGANLKLVRTFMKTGDAGSKEVEHGDPLFPTPDVNPIVFTMKRNDEPGVYITKLVDDNAPGKGAIAMYAHAFNVDTMREGNLERVGSDKLEQEFAKSEGAIIIVGPGMPEGTLVSKLNDFSESPWLFLLMLLVLVAEQALAVHLSFHLKKTENDLAPAGQREATV